MWKHIAIICVVGIVVMYLMTPSSQLHTLKDKRVLVTGASSGIGEQIAYMYAKYGASVVVTARRQKELKKVSDKCATLRTSENAKFYAVPSDMSLLNDAKRVIQESIKLLGGLDILVLNHVSGFKLRKYLGTQKHLDDFDYALDVSFRSHVHLASHALNQLRANNGSIIVINSLLGKVAMPGLISYSASKHALNGFFHSLGSDMKTFGGNVSVTCCTVGFTDTETAIDKMKNHFGASSVSMSPQAADKTAYDVVEAGARRVTRMYTPYFPDRLMALAYDLWPDGMEYLYNNIIASAQNLDL